MDSAAKTISAKSETIELLLQNTLPAAEVRAKLPNEIIIKTKMWGQNEFKKLYAFIFNIHDYNGM